MFTITIKKSENYLQTINEGLDDRKLSWRAKGLLTYLLNKPNDWTISTEKLEIFARCETYAVQSGLKELINNKYLIRGARLRTEDNTINYNYIMKG